MSHTDDGLPLKPLLRSLAVVFLHFNCGIVHFCEGQTHVIGPAQPIAASAGDDVTLPCHLDPATDAAGLTVEWSRTDLNPRFVHVWHEGQDLLDDQNPSYRTRTSLSAEKLKLGDLSLRLSRAKPSDKGRYRCFASQLDANAFVDLVISSTSSPAIVRVEINGEDVELECRCGGWYPEPELLWLDAEGNLLPAGPTETVRGSDDLYTVSSRVTVDKRHSSNITCRVQQTTTNQSRQTHIHVTADSLVAQSGSAVGVSVTVAVAALCILAVIAVVWWKRKTNKSLHVEDEQTVGDNGTAANNDGTENESLMKSLKQEEDVNRMFQKENLEMKLKTNEEEQKDLRQMMESVTGQRDELKKETQHGKKQTAEMETLIDETEEQAKELDQEITAKEVDKAQGYLKLKAIMMEGNCKVRKEIHQQEQQQLNTQRLMQSVETVLNKMTERTKKLEAEKEKWKQQLEDLRQRDDVYRTRPSHDSEQTQRETNGLSDNDPPV